MQEHTGPRRTRTRRLRVCLVPMRASLKQAFQISNLKEIVAV